MRVSMSLCLCSVLWLVGCGSVDTKLLTAGTWEGVSLDGSLPVVHDPKGIRLTFRTDGTYTMVGMGSEPFGGRYEPHGNSIDLIKDGGTLPISVKELSAKKLVINLAMMGDPIILTLKRD